MLHKKANSIEIFSDPTFSMTILTIKRTKSDASAGQCARGSYSNLAKSCRNPNYHLQHLQLNNCPPTTFL